MLSWLSLGVTKVARVGLCGELACYDSPFAKITLVALWKMDFREAERPFGSDCSNMVGDLGQCSYTSAGEMLNKLLPLPEHKTQTYLPATLRLSGAIQLAHTSVNISIMSILVQGDWRECLFSVSFFSHLLTVVLMLMPKAIL